MATRCEFCLRLGRCPACSRFYTPPRYNWSTNRMCAGLWGAWLRTCARVVRSRRRSLSATDPPAHHGHRRFRARVPIFRRFPIHLLVGTIFTIPLIVSSSSLPPFLSLSLLSIFFQLSVPGKISATRLLVALFGWR